MGFLEVLKMGFNLCLFGKSKIGFLCARKTVSDKV
jgi:hypothetical protein